MSAQQPSLNGQLLMFPLLASLGIITSRLAIAPDEILVDSQAFQPDRTSGMDLVRANPYFRAEPISHSVRQSRGGVPVDACAVDSGKEPLGEVPGGC